MPPSHKESKALSREPLPQLGGGQFWCILLTGDIWAIPGMVFSCLSTGRKKCRGHKDGSILVNTRFSFAKVKGFYLSLKLSLIVS